MWLEKLPSDLDDILFVLIKLTYLLLLKKKKKYITIKVSYICFDNY